MKKRKPKRVAPAESRRLRMKYGQDFIHKTVVEAALRYAQDIVNMRQAMMSACAATYFKAHPEALKYQAEIMEAAQKMVPRA